jgi:hypothetical protein
VCDMPALHSKWLLLLKIYISFAQKWVEVIFRWTTFKIMCNKISQKNPEYMLIYSLSCSCC